MTEFVKEEKIEFSEEENLANAKNVIYEDEKSGRERVIENEETLVEIDYKSGLVESEEQKEIGIINSSYKTDEKVSIVNLNPGAVELLDQINGNQTGNIEINKKYLLTEKHKYAKSQNDVIEKIGSKSTFEEEKKFDPLQKEKLLKNGNLIIKIEEDKTTKEEPQSARLEENSKPKNTKHLEKEILSELEISFDARSEASKTDYNLHHIIINENEQEKVKNFKPSKQHKIKLLSYNIFMRPPLICTNGNDYKNERLELLVNKISEFDIICFQEIFHNYTYRRKALCDSAKFSGFIYQGIPPDQPFFSKHMVGSGLLTLSKYPIIKKIFFPFGFNSGVDGLSYKGVLYTKILVGADPRRHRMKFMHLFNIHTQSSYSHTYEKGQHSNFKARLDQICEIRKTVNFCLSLHSNLDKKNPENFSDTVLIAGDFNVNSRAKNLPKVFDLADKKAQKWIDSQPGEDFDEYEYLIHVLSTFGRDKVIDHLLESTKEHPVTFGDSYITDSGVKLPRDVALSGKGDFCTEQSLDYFFEIIPMKKSKPNFKPDNEQGYSKVREFFVEKNVFCQLSDHYAVEIVLKDE